jgi:hypothetical protein
VWSFGIVLWEIATLGQTPYVFSVDRSPISARRSYPGLSNQQVFDFVTSGQVQAKPVMCSKDWFLHELQCASIHGIAGMI